mmetsp:Transcript_49154/g.137678  ORF Transcript_49154/g.137678 Transcript_49154/m.137678 type:complete len:252 (-) Transcript_49154:738-1493(-)
MYGRKRDLQGFGRFFGSPGHFAQLGWRDKETVLPGRGQCLLHCRSLDLGLHVRDNFVGRPMKLIGDGEQPFLQFCPARGDVCTPPRGSLHACNRGGLLARDANQLPHLHEAPLWHALASNATASTETAQDLFRDGVSQLETKLALCVRADLCAVEEAVLVLIVLFERCCTRRHDALRPLPPQRTFTSEFRSAADLGHVNVCSMYPTLNLDEFLLRLVRQSAYFLEFRAAIQHETHDALASGPSACFCLLRH